ncbi:phage tail tube protein [Streptococcus porcinus]
MATDSTKVVAGKPKAGGAIWSAPAGTTLPKDANTELDPAFKSLGYVSDDGLTNETTTDTEEIKAWGGDTVLTAQTGTSDTFTYKLIESLNVEVLKEVYGDKNVTGTLETGISISVNSKEKIDHVLVIEMEVRGQLKRIVIPVAKIKEMAEIKYVDGEPVGYELTVQALPDSKGNTHYEHVGGTPL